MRRIFYFITCSLLLVAGWTNALAQQQPSVSPAQRLALSVVDYQSTYDADAQTNTYTNTLQLSQPTGDYKLTAGMLNEGDNYITIHRLDNTGGDVECARVNLNCVQNGPMFEILDYADFYGDGTSAPSSNTYISSSDISNFGGSCWSTNGSSLIWQTNGCAYVTGANGLRFTVPSGYSNAILEVIIYVGSNARGGYFAYNVNGNTSWSYGADAEAGKVSSFIVGQALSTGDIIGIWGINSAGTSLYDSPDIEFIAVRKYPDSFTPTYEVTPTISYWDEENETWGEASALPGTSATTYTDNDVINLTGQVIDEFSVEIPADNEHPDYYSYRADFDADITLPASGTGTDFYASADFTGCTTDYLTSGTFTGYNGWSFYSSYSYEDDNNDIWGFVEYYGSITFTMPNSFMGNSVNITVTSGPCLDHSGSGDLYVNGVLHTFNGASTYTWNNVAVTAGGTIEIRGPRNTWSADIASIVISSGNGSKMNMPLQQNKAKNSLIGDGNLLLKGFKGRSEGKVGKIEKKASTNTESKIMLKSND